MTDLEQAQADLASGDRDRIDNGAEVVMTCCGPLIHSCIANDLAGFGNSDVLDVFQDVSVKLIENAIKGAIRADGDIKPYVCRIAKFTAIDFIRKKQRKPTESIDLNNADFENVPNQIDIKSALDHESDKSEADRLEKIKAEGQRIGEKLAQIAKTSKGNQKIVAEQMAKAYEKLQETHASDPEAGDSFDSEMEAPGIKKALSAAGHDITAVAVKRAREEIVKKLNAA